MIDPMTIFIGVAAVFAGASGLVFLLKSKRSIMLVPACASALTSALTGFWGLRLLRGGAFTFCGGNMIIAPLSMFHILLVDLLFTSTSLYMIDYFPSIDDSNKGKLFYFRRFAALWMAFQAMLLLVLLSNNIGLTWIALESTTIVSSFLILSESDSLSIEAMWKYLLICSVGIALAFIGTILIIAAAQKLPSHDSLYTFSELQKYATSLDPKLTLFAFIFIAVGFGTKSGLAPMHTWLPDAHSQAPSPVSAVFSGVMLNCALFVIMRYLPIVDASMGPNGHAHAILIVLGVASLLIATIFIPIQHDVKRLLAYHSVEHIGIIAIGLGLGGLGTVAALFHTLNHSLSKMLAFFSAGSMIKHYKTRDMREITAALKATPTWGLSFLVSMFVLLGIAPSSIFLSELMIAKTAFFGHRYVILGLFIFGTLAVFVSALKHVLDVSCGPLPQGVERDNTLSIWNKITIVICFAEFLIFGLWIPEPFMTFLQSAAHIVEHGIQL